MIVLGIVIYFVVSASLFIALPREYPESNFNAFCEFVALAFVGITWPVYLLSRIFRIIINASEEQ